MNDGHQDIYGAMEANYNANIMSHREMNARITEIVTRLGSADGAIEALTKALTESIARINALEACVRPTRAEVELVQGHRPSCNTAQVVR